MLALFFCLIACLALFAHADSSAVTCADNCSYGDTQCVSQCLGYPQQYLADFVTCSSGCGSSNQYCMNECALQHLGYNPDAGTVSQPTQGTPGQSDVAGNTSPTQNTNQQQQKKTPPPPPKSKVINTTATGTASVLSRGNTVMAITAMGIAILLL